MKILSKESKTIETLNKKLFESQTLLSDENNISKKSVKIPIEGKVKYYLDTNRYYKNFYLLKDHLKIKLDKNKNILINSTVGIVDKLDELYLGKKYYNNLSKISRFDKNIINITVNSSKEIKDSIKENKVIEFVDGH